MNDKTLAFVSGSLILAFLLSIQASPSNGSAPAKLEAANWQCAANSVASDVVDRIDNAIPAFEYGQEAVYKLVRRIEWSGNHIFFTAFSPDGKRYLGGGDTGTLRIWEVASGDQLIELPVPVGVFMPDGKEVLGCQDKTMSVFEVASGKVVRSWEASEPVVSLAIAPDGKQAVTGLADNTLRLWDLATKEELRKFEAHVEPPSAVFSPDGKQILSASKDKTVRLWEAETGKLVRTFEDFNDAIPNEGHDLVVQAFFLPGGRQIAGSVWGTDKTLLVWNVADGTVVRKLDLGADHHKDVAISPDGRWFLTAHDDRTVRVRDLTTGKEIQRLDVTDTNVARAPNFSRDGRSVVAGSWRSWVYLWQLPE